MANLVKIAELLKNAPDQALMQELNNPSATTPSYMVISELQRRKKLRGSMLSPEPQSSVAEDLEAESAQASQMGLGAMQPQQAPQGYAQGGEVKHFFAGGDMGTDASYTSEQGWNPFSWFGEKHGVTTPTQMGFGYMGDPEYKKWIELGLSPEQAKAKVTGADSRIGKTPDTEPAVRQAPLAAGSVAAPKPQGASGIGGPRAPAAPATGGISDYMNELKGYRKDLADAYQKQADVYQQQADKLESGKSKDVALALMQAGFGIMGGRSQNAAENIGQGAMPAIQQYAGMDRARQEQAQKLAMGQSQLGIESLRARMEGAKTEAGLGLTEREVGAKERTARAHEISAGASASQAGAYRQAANEARIIGLREKAIEALSKDQDFQFLSPQQQEAAIQRRMQLIGIPGAGSAPAAPAIAGTYNPKTGKIE